MRDHIGEYKGKFSLISSFTEELETLITKLLVSNKIKYHFIESRTKSVESFGNKVKGKKYANPMADVTDLSGIRIITYYEEDIEKISSLLKANFTYFEKLSIDKKQILESNEFGYQSVHLILSINKKREAMPEWSSYSNMMFEVQVRTVLQHAWASISHELDYKNKHDVPRLLRRKLFRLAGLFELADEEFSELRDEYNKLKKAIDSNEKIDNIDVSNELNLVALQSFYKKNEEIINRVNLSATSSGFTLEDDSDFDSQYMSNQLQVAKNLGINSIQEFKTLLESLILKADSIFSQVYGSSTGDTWMGGPMFFVSLLFHFVDKGLSIDSLSKMGWNREIAKTAIQGIKAARKLDKG